MNPMSETAYLESEVWSADPIGLVRILYEHSILSVQDARRHLAAGEIAGRSKAISKTMAIIGELDASLDHRSGGSLSQELARLYEYLLVRLTVSNLEQKDEPLAEVESILRTLGEAWNAIGSDSSKPPEERFFAVPQDLEAGCAAHSWSA
jgi:flagellar secretion chaperone FliS